MPKKKENSQKLENTGQDNMQPTRGEKMDKKKDSVYDYRERSSKAKESIVFTSN